MRKIDGMIIRCTICKKQIACQGMPKEAIESFNLHVKECKKTYVEKSMPKIVKDFIYGGRRCVVVLIDWGDNTPHSKYHNGYIEVSKSEMNRIEDSDFVEEITYGGDLSNCNAKDGKLYIGFDTCHLDNWEHPETTTSEYVEKQCKKIVDELNKTDKVKQ